MPSTDPWYYIEKYLFFRVFSIMKGPAAPDAWQGGINVTYKLGPGFRNANWYVNYELKLKDSTPGNTGRVHSTYYIDGAGVSYNP